MNFGTNFEYEEKLINYHFWAKNNSFLDLKSEFRTKF
jgi:hypothetical protein